MWRPTMRPGITWTKAMSPSPSLEASARRLLGSAPGTGARANPAGRRRSRAQQVAAPDHPAARPSPRLPSWSDESAERVKPAGSKKIKGRRALRAWDPSASRTPQQTDERRVSRMLRQVPRCPGPVVPSAARRASQPQGRDRTAAARAVRRLGFGAGASSTNARNAAPFRGVEVRDAPVADIGFGAEAGPWPPSPQCLPEDRSPPPSESPAER